VTSKERSKPELEKKDLVKQSFVGRREMEKVKCRRRNKSEQKIIEHSSEEEEGDEIGLLKEQLQALKPARRELEEAGPR
jgi:hypothetical protein